jgi:hypothetical protein
MKDGDISKFIQGGAMQMRAGLAFVSVAGSHPDASEEVIVDAGEIVDTLAFLTALVVESDPAARSNQGLRLSSEEIGRRVAAYARSIRAEGERTGVPVIMHFGGTGNIVPMAADGLALN